MSYDNFNENAPAQTNNIFSDLDSIRNDLNTLREQGLNVNFPTKTVPGMPFARLEVRDDNALQNKVVVYRRNAANDGWIKVVDEEYEQNAVIYKGIDIDTNGDGKVNSADVADSANTYKGKDIDTDGDGKVDSAVNADYATNAGNAATADSTAHTDYATSAGKWHSGRYIGSGSNNKFVAVGFTPDAVIITSDDVIYGRAGNYVFIATSLNTVENCVQIVSGGFKVGITGTQNNANELDVFHQYLAVKF